MQAGLLKLSNLGQVLVRTRSSLVLGSLIRPSHSMWENIASQFYILLMPLHEGFIPYFCFYLLFGLHPSILKTYSWPFSQGSGNIHSTLCSAEDQAKVGSVPGCLIFCFMYPHISPPPNSYKPLLQTSLHLPLRESVHIPLMDQRRFVTNLWMKCDGRVTVLETLWKPVIKDFCFIIDF